MNILNKEKLSHPKTKIKEVFRVEDPETSNSMGEFLVTFLPPAKAKELIFLGIGSDRSTGDSLGPLVGSCLEELCASDIYILGTLNDPVHAVNLMDRLQFIKNNFSQPFIIAVDSSLGRAKNIGNIKVENGPLVPGIGVNKKLPPAGDIHITGTVNVGGFMEYLVLQNTRLGLVMRLAKTISKGLVLGLQKHFP